MTQINLRPKNAAELAGASVRTRLHDVASGDFSVGVLEADGRPGGAGDTIVYFPGFGGRIDGEHGVEQSRTELIARELGARVLYISSPFTEDPDVMGRPTPKMPLSLASDIARGNLGAVSANTVNAIKEVTKADAANQLQLWSYSQGNSLALGAHNAIAEQMPGVSVPRLLAIEPQAMSRQFLPGVLRRSAKEGAFDPQYLQENVDYGYLPVPLGNKTKEQHDKKFGALFGQQITALGSVGLLLASPYFASNLLGDLWERSSQTGLSGGQIDLVTVAGSSMTDAGRTASFVNRQPSFASLRHIEAHAPLLDGRGHHGVVHSMARMASLLDQLGS